MKGGDKGRMTDTGQEGSRRSSEDTDHITGRRGQERGKGQGRGRWMGYI